MEIGNLLEGALSVLPFVCFKYRSFRRSEVDEFGQSVQAFNEWKLCRGMVQPVNRSLYEDMGLDFTKTYISVWGSIPLDASSEKQDGSDQLLWNGHLWNITAVNEWNQYNGWANVTAVEERLWEDTQHLSP